MAYFFRFGNNKNTKESEAENMTDEKDKKKKQAKVYEKYAKQFTPTPHYFRNMLKAFITGGLICTVAMLLQNQLIAGGMDQKTAGNTITILLVVTAQLLTGLGIFDSIGKFAGAGVIVPITGFANAMVAPAIEYKKEGVVLGVGAKLFSVAGPVLVCGITVSTVIGVIYWMLGMLG